MPKKPPPRNLTPEEQAAWQAAAGLVTPLRAREKKTKPVKAPQRPVSHERPARADMPYSRKPQQPLGKGQYDGVDKSTRERFRKGDYPIDARLDLHGMTHDRACRAVEDFIHHHYLEQHRCLLIVTGKGNQASDAVAQRGVLRAALPGWLADASLRPYILAFDTAKPKHGGSGAVYVLLKRRRST
ncbi:MAG: Smr/MutS family protein [Alphaproteobacteria bacterium]